MRNKNSHIVLVSQKVKDIKVPRKPQLELAIGHFRRWLHKHRVIPGDKLPAVLTPVIFEDGVLKTTITGTVISNFDEFRAIVELDLPLPMASYSGAMEIESILSACPGVVVDDGGNIQNMAVNLAIAASYLKRYVGLNDDSFQITVASSSNPFERLPASLAADAASRCRYFKMDICDRLSIQLPYLDGEESGTLCITSEPVRTSSALEDLIAANPEFKKAFLSANCFVSADPIYEALRRHAQPPFATVVNASTSFRSLVATESYGHTVLLPMNRGEAAEVCRLLVQRGLEAELDEVELPHLPAPFEPDGSGIAHGALAILDESIHTFTSYIPIGHPSIACPISFDEDGGFLIGAGQLNLACFSSIPSPAGARAMIAEYGDKSELLEEEIDTVGAGDAVATVIALFNAVHPRSVLQRHLTGRERDNVRFIEMAGTVFISILSRIAGCFVLHTKRTHWSSISSKKFPKLIDDVCKESVKESRRIFPEFSKSAFCSIDKWGIQIVLWVLGTAIADAAVKRGKKMT